MSDDFGCCGGNDGVPRHHTSDCSAHPWSGRPDPRCLDGRATCPHASPKQRLKQAVAAEMAEVRRIALSYAERSDYVPAADGDPAYLPGSIIRGPSFSDPKRIVTGLVLGQHTDGLDEWWVETIDRDEKPSNMVLLTQPIEVLRFAGEIRSALAGGALARRIDSVPPHPPGAQMRGLRRHHRSGPRDGPSRAGCGGRIEIMKRVRATLSPNDTADGGWCDFDADVLVLLDMTDECDRKEAGRILRSLVAALTDHDSNNPYLELHIKGRMYMTGRLPKGATFKPDGTKCPDVVIVDDVHGWDFKEPKARPKKKRPSPTGIEGQ
jgi:hypothetical protein